MTDYARRNWNNCAFGGLAAACHRRYHYTDVAIQRDRYDRSYFGTSDHDIVSAMQAAIDVLQGRPAPEPFSIKDRKEALLMLTHLVGDVHQPLHVGAIYLGLDGQLIDPDADPQPPDPRTGTRGGNSIDDGPIDLHSAWDLVPDGPSPLTISADALMAAKAVSITPGNLRSWPAAWAGESVLVGRAVYAGISFTRDPARNGRWLARFDDHAAYLQTKQRVQTEQLLRAGARLAQLLNAIWP
jgi:hypothetical protein